MRSHYKQRHVFTTFNQKCHVSLQIMKKKLASDHLANWLENKEKLFDDIHIPAKSTKETLNAAFLLSLKENAMESLQSMDISRHAI